MTRPLNELADAADEIGRGARQDPIAPVGPLEVRELTAAFNGMQSRLARFVTDRTQMLAALAHDLRSPLTALRVRAEMVDDAETREGIAASIEEMHDMVEATLAYAKGVGRDEPSQRLRLTEFLSSLALETDTQFTVGSDMDVMLQIKPKALRRALRNVIENAERYANAPIVSWETHDSAVKIFVDDDGPGVPEKKLAEVFQPYVRLETSRSRTTGGHGLGLSIARSIILEQGGNISLSNRPGGGAVSK